MHRSLSLCAALAAVLLLAACDSDDTNDGPAEAGDAVTVAYAGRLTDGTLFDQSSRANFTLDNSLIPGFRDRIIGMIVGETRTFAVPPEEAYGEEGVVDPDTGEVIIPPNATLTFEVTLLAIN